MPLKDFLPEYKPLARFAGYLALAAAVAAPVYLSNKEYRRQIRELREAVERLEDARGTDQKNVRDFLEKYVGVVEGMGKGMEEQREKIAGLEKSNDQVKSGYTGYDKNHGSAPVSSRIPPSQIQTAPAGGRE